MKPVRDAMKKYAELCDFAETFALATENMLVAPTDSFERFFVDETASVVKDHRCWYYEPSGCDEKVSIREYCQFFKEYSDYIRSVRVENMRVRNCMMNDEESVFEIDMDKIIVFEDKELPLTRIDTCNEILHIHDVNGILKIMKITWQNNPPFCSLQQTLGEYTDAESGMEVLLAKKPYYLFCVNVTPAFDAKWVVRQIDSILEKSQHPDFTVYYTMGYSAVDVNSYYNSIEISDAEKWNKSKTQLQQITEDSILRDQSIAAPTRIDMEILLARHYEENVQNGLAGTSAIRVHWFGDEELYKNNYCGIPFIKDLYLRCNGCVTWESLELKNNNETPLSNVDMSLFEKYNVGNIKVNNK